MCYRDALHPHAIYSSKFYTRYDMYTVCVYGCAPADMTQACWYVEGKTGWELLGPMCVDAVGESFQYTHLCVRTGCCAAGQVAGCSNLSSRTDACTGAPRLLRVTFCALQQHGGTILSTLTFMY